PYATLRHHEGASRGRRDPDRSALELMRRRWGARLDRDPFYRAAPADHRVAPADARPVASRSAADVARGAGLALVAGGPVATRGRPNRYWVRLVNPTERACEVEVRVEGRAVGGGFRLATRRTLAAGAADDLCCESDWRDRAAFVDVAPPLEGVAE